MRVWIVNIVCAAGIGASALLYTRDAAARKEHDDAVARRAEAGKASASAGKVDDGSRTDAEAIRKREDARRKVDELVTKAYELKAKGIAHKVELPELIEVKRSDAVTFGQMEAMPREVKDPKFDRTKIPAELLALDGKMVSVTGYLLVIFAVEPVTEVFLAKTPYDACCLGVPPTLFNSVMVTLDPNLPFRKGNIRISTYRGRFRVNPRFEDGILTGLYRLENAYELTPEEAACEAAEQKAGVATAGSTDGSDGLALEPVRNWDTYYLAAAGALLLVGLANTLVGRRAADEHADLRFVNKKLSLD